MSGPQSSQVSEADARSLTQKLAEFSRTLTPGEQAALQQVIQRSMGQGEDVQGFSSWDPSDANSWWNWWSWNWQQ